MCTDKEPVGTQGDERLKLSYEAAKDILKSQDTTLGNIRTRASNLLTVAALVTSFSAGLGLINADHRQGAVLPTAGAWLLFAVLLAIGGFVLSVLWPVKVWHFGPDPREIFRRTAGGEGEDKIRAFAVERMIDGIKLNENTLVRKQAVFRWSVILLLVEVAVLIGALTLFN